MWMPPLGKPPSSMVSSPGTPLWRRSIRCNCVIRPLPVWLRATQGQRNNENRSLAGHALDHDRAAHRYDELVGQPQPDAEPAVIAVRYGALEPFEDAGAVRFGNADAVIAHGQLRGPSVRAQ